MRDYLDNLVAKSLGAAPAVLPRPVSLFEPLQPAGLVYPVSVSAKQYLTPEEKPAEAPVVRLNVARPTAESHRADQPEIQTHATAPRGLPEPDRGTIEAARPLISPLSVPPLRDVAERVTEQRNTAHISQPRLEIPEPMQQPPVPPALHAIDGPEHQTAAPQGGVNRAPAATQEEMAQLTPLPTQSGTLLPPAFTRKAAGDAPASSGRPQPLRTARSNISEISSEISPTIRVTIGRVDVRAVLSEQPARRAQPEAHKPAVSLEEYLKQRSRE